MTGDEFGDQPDQRFGQAASRFQESLLVLDQRIDWIPAGWQRLYGDMRFKLRAVQCEARHPIRVDGAYETEGFLCVEAVTNDKVIQGILRKARATALATCMGCGNRGKPREIGDDGATLCASCAGCLRLRDEIQSILVKQYRGCSITSALREHPLVAGALQAALEQDDGNEAFLGTTEMAMTAWFNSMIVLLDPIADGIRL